jgi:predicted permease
MSKHPLSDLDAEMRDHIARETEDNVARGMTPGEAHLAARRKFGSVVLAEERAREVWTPRGFDQVRQDVHYALRVLARSPGFTIVSVLTLALGIGLTTAVFSVLNAVLLQPLPYADGDRIVFVRETLRGQVGNASAGHFHDWTEHNTVFEHTAAGQAATFTLSGESDPERLRGMRVTPGYFHVAHMPPAVGRYFSQADTDADERVVVLSHSLWHSRFAGDARIVGREIRLGGEPYTVVGVAPDSFALTNPASGAVVGGFSSQLWTPLTFAPDQRTNFGAHYLGVLAKLREGVTLAHAREDIERVTRGIAERHPKEMSSRGVLLEPLREELVGNVRAQLVVLTAAVAFVLFIGCVNISSLLVARATTRRREIAIRASLGGGQSRIVRQLLTESLVLAAAGGAASLLVAITAINFLVGSGPATLPRLRDAGLQFEVLLFAFGITAAAAVGFGLAPAIRAARVDLQASLRDGGRSAVRGGRDRLRTVMVVAETAMTVVLLIGTGLLIRSADKLKQVPYGFNPHQVVTARLTLPAARYSDDARVADAYRRMLEPLRATPGIEYAGASSHIPLVSPNASASTFAEGRPVPLDAAPNPAIRLVTEDYLEAIGMSIASGRSFQTSDMTTEGPRVVVINERLAAALWPGEDAVGKRLSTWNGPDDQQWRQVIGIARDTRSFGQSSPVEPELFIPYTQAPFQAWTAFSAAWRSSCGPERSGPRPTCRTSAGLLAMWMHRFPSTKSGRWKTCSSRSPPTAASTCGWSSRYAPRDSASQCSGCTA